jgi:serine/threonine protein kinase
LCSLAYLAITNSNQQENPVVIKGVEGHWRLPNERDILKRFQARTPTLRPLLDEIEDPAEPPAIVLKYLDDDITRASRKQRLTRQEIKYVAKNVLEALQVLHEDGYVHTGTLDFKHSSVD